MAEAALDAALGRIKGRREAVEAVVEPTLIVRGTTGPPRA
jgi:DNA-binding LacI/PurR family transcriptional regulator